MSNQWEDDDDDWYSDDEETTDMGDEPQVTAKLQAPIVENRQAPRSPIPSGNGSKQQSKGKRTVRVRPMHPTMAAKWPDITSCLLTFGSGKQVLFVKGG